MFVVLYVLLLQLQSCYSQGDEGWCERSGWEEDI